MKTQQLIDEIKQDKKDLAQLFTELEAKIVSFQFKAQELVNKI